MTDQRGKEKHEEQNLRVFLYVYKVASKYTGNLNLVYSYCLSIHLNI